MMRTTYQAANVTKAWWNFFQWSSKNRWVKPTWVMIHDSMCNECKDKRTSKIMRYFVESVWRPWEDVVWSQMKKYGVEPRCGCESHIYMTWKVRQLDDIWDEITIDFLNLLINESRRSRQWMTSLFAMSYEEMHW
jgi:hypothetical protein